MLNSMLNFRFALLLLDASHLLAKRLMCLRVLPGDLLVDLYPRHDRPRVNHMVVSGYKSLQVQRPSKTWSFTCLSIGFV